MYLLPTLGFLTFPLMIAVCYFGATWVIKKYEKDFDENKD